MTRRALVPIGSALCAMFMSIPAEAENSNPQTAWLSAVSVKLDEDNIYSRVWRDAFDKILARRKVLSEKLGRPPILTTDVFAVTFKSTNGQGDIVMSATATLDKDCESYANVGLSPSLMTCPLRIVLVQSDRLKLLYQEDSFAFAIGVDDKGVFDNEDKDNHTEVVFDPEEKTISVALTAKGDPIYSTCVVSSTSTCKYFDPNDSRIKLNY